jgi:hypothetical protein
MTPLAMNDRRTLMPDSLILNLVFAAGLLWLALAAI